MDSKFEKIVIRTIMKELMENVLPYLGIEPEYTEKETEMNKANTFIKRIYKRLLFENK